MDPLTELNARPGYDQAVATYTAMQNEIETATTAAVPGTKWLPDDRGIQAGCSAPFDNLGGRGGGLDTSYIDGGIPDDAWAAALTAATDVAARYGLTDITVIVDRPGRHEATFFNPDDGTNASLGTDGNASLLVTTGCNLPAAKLLPAPPTS